MLASSRKLLVAVVAAGLGVAGTAAIAQQAAAPDKGGWNHEHHHMLPGQLIEARLAYIKTALQITPAQTPQWNAFADVMRKKAKERDEMITEMQAKTEQHKDGDAKPDLITMMEHRQKILEKASAGMSEYIAALKPLYASFSDSQKEIAPQVLGHHGHDGWQHGAGR